MDSQSLSLSEYSHKYRVSVSTLRRRIRARQIAFQLKDGKYFLEDQIPENIKQHSKSRSDNPENSHQLEDQKEMWSDSAKGHTVKNHTAKKQYETWGRTARANQLKNQFEIWDRIEKNNQLKNQYKTHSDNTKSHKVENNIAKSNQLKNPFTERSEKPISEEVFKESRSLNRDLGDNVPSSKADLYQQITQKEIKLQEQENIIMDLNTLTALLEKENKVLKSLLYQEKDMEEWLVK